MRPSQDPTPRESAPEWKPGAPCPFCSTPGRIKFNGGNPLCLACSNWMPGPPRIDYSVRMGDVGAPDSETCEHAGHEWAPAGGGLLICMCCEAEKWEED